MESPKRQFEYQYYDFIKKYADAPLEKYGLVQNCQWKHDPRRLLFVYSRYKFVSKMFEGFETVLEVGCADAFATRLVQQTVRKVVVSDFDKIFIDDILSRQQPDWHLDARVHDMTQAPIQEKFDGVFCLDVLEHIEQEDENAFVMNICLSLNKHGSAIFGMPSLESQTYASEASKLGHVNCKSGVDFRAFLKKYFHSVFMFSMNDEVLHTGFFPMSHYLIAVCADKKSTVE